MKAQATCWIARSLALVAGLALGWSASSKSRDEESGDRQPAVTGDPGDTGQAPTTVDGAPAPGLDPAEGESRGRTSFARLMDRLIGASPADFPALWDEFVVDLSDDDLIDFSWSALSNREWLIQAWVAVDAEGALAHVASLNSEFNVRRLFSQWFKTDPAAAMRAIDAALPESLGVSERTILAALADYDPRMALERLGEEGRRSDPGSHRIIIREWAKIDADATLAYLRSQGGGEPGTRELIAMSRGWPLERLGEILPLLEGGSADSAFSQIAGRLARADSDLGIDWILSLPAGAGQTQILDQFLWQSRDSVDTIAALARLPAEQISKLGRLDGLLGGDFANRAEVWKTTLGLPGEVRQALTRGNLGELSYGWGLDDMDAAFAALRDYPADLSDGKESFASGISRAIGQRDPQAGLEMASQLPADGRAGFIRSMAESWADTDFEGYSAYLESAADTPATLALQRGGFGVIAEVSPATAVALLGSLEGGDYNDGVAQIASSWALLDPAAAVGFVGGLRDPAAHDSAATALGSALESHDPSNAARAYLSIQNQEQREQQLFNFIGSFASENLAAAQELLRATTMGAEDRAFMEAVIED